MSLPRERPSAPSLPSRRQSGGRRFGGWLLVGVGAALAGLGIWALMGGGPLHPVQVVQVREGTIQVQYPADAVLARHEYVQQAPAAGVVNPQVQEAQRVRVGARLAWIVPGGAPAPQRSQQTSPADVTRLQELYREYDQLGHDLYDAVVAQQAAISKGDTSRISQGQRTLTTLSRQQTALAEQISSIETHAAPVVAPVATPKTAQEVSARRAGIVSFRLDGLETRLNPQESHTWDIAWYTGLPANLPTAPRERVEAGQELVKIVDNLGAAVAFPVPEGAREQLHVGETYRLRLTDLASDLTVRVRRMSDATEGKMLVVADADTLPEALVAVRRTSVSLEAASFSGLIVPRTAVGQQDGQPGVWKLVDRRTHFVPVQVQGGDEEHVVVAGALRAGDAVVLSPPS